MSNPEDRPRTVEVSIELLDQLREWSRPVQFKDHHGRERATRDADAHATIGPRGDDVSKTIVYCSRCEEPVDVTAQMTPTLPPMLPNMPEFILLSNAGHVCNPQHVMGNVASALAALPSKREGGREGGCAGSSGSNAE